MLISNFEMKKEKENTKEEKISNNTKHFIRYRYTRLIQSGYDTTDAVQKLIEECNVDCMAIMAALNEPPRGLQ